MDHPLSDIDRALELLRTLPEDRQRLAADIIEDLARPAKTHVLTSEERAICEAALASQLATEAEVDDLLNKPW